MLDNNCKLSMTWKKTIVIGTWTSKQEEENQESSNDEQETEWDSMMLRTFHHTTPCYFSCLYAISSSNVLHIVLDDKEW